MSIRVQIADDHPLTLIGIHTLLENRANLDVVAQAHSVEALLENLQRHPCDLLLTDLMMPGGEQVDGIRLIRRLRTLYPQLAIVVITMLDNPALISSVLKLGIQGLVSKRGLLADLPRALRASLRRPFLSESIRRQLGESEAEHGKPLASAEELSPREAEVLRLYGSGMAIGEIALHLNRSKQTISAQKSSAMRKLGIDTNAGLFHYIQEAGLC